MLVTWLPMALWTWMNRHGPWYHTHCGNPPISITTAVYVRVHIIKGHQKKNMFEPTFDLWHPSNVFKSLVVSNDWFCVWDTPSVSYHAWNFQKHIQRLRSQQLTNKDVWWLHSSSGLQVGMKTMDDWPVDLAYTVVTVVTPCFDKPKSGFRHGWDILKRVCLRLGKPQNHPKSILSNHHFPHQKCCFGGVLAIFRHTQTSSSMRLMLVARIHSSGPDGASDPTMAHLDNLLSEVHLPKKNRLVLYVLWSKHLKKHVVWYLTHPSHGNPNPNIPGFFYRWPSPLGGVDHPNTRSFRWWVSSKQGVSQFSCFQLKDCIILAVFDGKPRFVERWAWLDFVRCHCFPGSEVMKNLGLRCGVFKCEWFFVYMWGWKWCSKNKTYVQ